MRLGMTAHLEYFSAGRDVNVLQSIIPDSFQFFPKPNITSLDGKHSDKIRCHLCQISPLREVHYHFYPLLQFGAVRWFRLWVIPSSDKLFMWDFRNGSCLPGELASDQSTSDGQSRKLNPAVLEPSESIQQWVHSSLVRQDGKFVV